MISLFLLERADLSEHLTNAVDACHKGIDLFFCIVKGEAGTNGAFDAEAVHEGFCTVVTCAHSNAEAIKEGAEVEVVNE